MKARNLTKNDNPEEVIAIRFASEADVKLFEMHFEEHNNNNNNNNNNNEKERNMNVNNNNQNNNKNNNSYNNGYKNNYPKQDNSDSDDMKQPLKNDANSRMGAESVDNIATNGSNYNNNINNKKRKSIDSQMGGVKKTKGKYKKIKEQFELLEKNPLQFCQISLKNGESLKEWTVIMNGPTIDDSPYFGGEFEILIEFPDQYPACPPIITFVTKIFHLNIDANRKVFCESIDANYWNKKTTIRSILDEIYHLLEVHSTNEPYIKNKEVQTKLRSGYENYVAEAKKWTQQYAKSKETPKVELVFTYLLSVFFVVFCFFLLFLFNFARNTNSRINTNMGWQKICNRATVAAMQLIIIIIITSISDRFATLKALHRLRQHGMQTVCIYIFVYLCVLYDSHEKTYLWIIH